MGASHTLSLPVCISASVLTMPFLCEFSHWFCVSDNKHYTCFYSFRLLEKCIYLWQQEPGQALFQLLSPAGLVAGIPGFHPSHPGSIPGQGTKISLQVTAHCCVSEITSRCEVVVSVLLKISQCLVPAGLGHRH